MSTRFGLPLCLAGMDIAVPTPGSLRSPPGALHKQWRSQQDGAGATLDSPAVEAVSSGLAAPMPGSGKRRSAGRRGRSPSSAIASAGESKAARRGRVGLSGPPNQPAAAKVASRNSPTSMEGTGVLMDHQHGCTPPADTLSQSPTFPRMPVTLREGLGGDDSCVEDSLRESDAASESADSDGAEEASDAEPSLGSPMERHRHALSAEMAQLDRLRSALREREHHSHADAHHHPVHLQPLDSEDQGQSTSPGHGTASSLPDWPSSLPPQSGRALDIIRAGLADTAPTRWDSTWQAWGAKAA